MNVLLLVRFHSVIMRVMLAPVGWPPEVGVVARPAQGAERGDAAEGAGEPASEARAGGREAAMGGVGWEPPTASAPEARVSW
ncbi:hypothetical protein [Dactylosporangium sp. NPDC048998]|uniref:hypothetical protein n=1 Tax=Dactylosporangium sp. NPDC048998 TaxID=3363976 RepID=UPI0037133C03